MKSVDTKLRTSVDSNLQSLTVMGDGAHGPVSKSTTRSWPHSPLVTLGMGLNLRGL